MTGTIHIESVVNRNYTLGEFLTIWGFNEEKIVKVSNGDGTEISDYENHILSRNARIVIEIQD
jgi:sulfur carrier protein ThiS